MDDNDWDFFTNPAPAYKGIKRSREHPWRNDMSNDDLDKAAEEFGKKLYETEADCSAADVYGSLGFKAGAEWATRWVSVVEKLPLPEDEVLWFSKYGEMHVGSWYYSDLRKRKIVEWGEASSLSIGENITHWMPLPTAPTQEPCERDPESP